MRGRRWCAMVKAWNRAAFAPTWSLSASSGFLPVVLILVLHLTLPDYNASGQCTGLGFGCTPPPADAVLFLGYFAALPLFLLGLVVCLVIAVVRARRDRRKVTAAGQPSEPDSQSS